MAYNKSPLTVKMENIVSLIQNNAEFLEFACDVICNSTVKLNEEQREKIMNVLKEQTTLPTSPPSPFLMPGEMEISNFFILEGEVKPDTLLENSCTICGASFMDHGEKACNDYACLYNVRNPASECDTGFADADADADTEEDSSPSASAALPSENWVKCDTCDTLFAHTDTDTEEDSSPSSSAPSPVEEKDNWVQCDCCDTWRKVASLENMTNEWYCSDIKKACRAPSEAENHWPATRAKYAVRFCDTGYGYYNRYEHKTYEGNRVPSHMECLKILAERKKITLEELYRTRPENYFGKEYDNFSRFMHGNTRSAYNYFWR